MEEKYPDQTETMNYASDPCCKGASPLGQSSSLKARVENEIYDLQKKLAAANKVYEALVADPGIESTLQVMELLRKIGIR